MCNAASGVSEKVQSCQRSWPTARCPNEESAIMAVLDFAYGRYNMLHPSKKETQRLGVCSVTQDTCLRASGSQFVFVLVFACVRARVCVCVCGCVGVWVFVGLLVG